MGTGFNDFQGMKNSFHLGENHGSDGRSDIFPALLTHDSSAHNDHPSTINEFFDVGNASLLDENFINNLDFSNQEQLTEDHNSLVEPKTSSIDSNFSSSSENAIAATTLSPGAEMGFSEDFEGSSGICLNYINQILMEDDLDDKFNIYPKNQGLQAAQQPFYEALGEKFPPVDQISFCNSLTFDGSNNNNHNQNMYARAGLNLLRADNDWPYDPTEFRQLQHDPVPIQYTSGFGIDRFADRIDVFDVLSGSELQTQSQPASQFQTGLDEALKFLPRNENLVIDFESNGVYMPRELEYQQEKSTESKSAKVRKNPHDEDLDELEGRRGKQPAVSLDDDLDIEMFDRVLLLSSDHGIGTGITELQEKMHNEARKIYHERKSAGRKVRGTKSTSSELVDLRALLIACAQAITTYDQKSANALLKQIRQHSSTTGNANQRVAHYFAEGLEARLAGTGSQVHYSLVAKQIPMSDFLKAYQLYLAACPFTIASHFFANKVIIKAVKDARKVHIIDFGTQYGFQWPSFLQKLAFCYALPPTIRMTGIDTPKPGFRPTAFLDQAGQRLADYARKFKVPFEFCAIATRWDAIRVEDLNIEEDELVIVNCLYQLNKLGDETVCVDSQRNVVLKTIRELNPTLFIHGNCNGSHNSPFFTTRFREALFHFSALFDMMEANVPREEEQRLLIEKMKFGQEIINIVACEGSERVERPETYKQFIERNISAGFVQVPIDAFVAKMMKDKIKEVYNKDFSLEEDRECLLMGWKGRILQSLSIWKPNHSS